MNRRTPSRQPAGASTGADEAPRIIAVTVERAAHGGTFVGRLDSRVVFVRGAAPGETVLARLLPDSHESDRFWRAEAIDVIEPSPDRVESVWPEAGADGIGGADYAHIRIEAQRRIKTEVLQELLGRAGVQTFPIDEAQVQPAADDRDGLGWRTRVRFAVHDGMVGMRGWRSHEVYPVGANPLAHPTINALGLGGWRAPRGVQAVDAVAPSLGAPAIVVHASEPLSLEALDLPRSADGASVLVNSRRSSRVLRGEAHVREVVAGEEFEVSSAGFWQVHVQAPALLSSAVHAALDASQGEVLWDLYAGAGVFSVPAARAVGPTGRVHSVESSHTASVDAAANLARVDWAQAHHADVSAFVEASGEHPDRVVVDPPRAGVGQSLMQRLCDVTSTAIVYVSCEPSTLVRDLVVAERAGWKIGQLQAFDLFPHTHHLETVVQLERA